MPTRGNTRTALAPVQMPLPQLKHCSGQMRRRCLRRSAPASPPTRARSSTRARARAEVRKTRASPAGRASTHSVLAGSRASKMEALALAVALTDARARARAEIESLHHHGSLSRPLGNAYALSRSAARSRRMRRLRRTKHELGSKQQEMPSKKSANAAGCAQRCQVHTSPPLRFA